MFGQKQAMPPTPAPPRDGIEFSFRLSGANFIKLASIVGTLLLSSGLLMHSTSQDLAVGSTVELMTQADD
ncbi:hypothetical protein IQ260_14730 [Leptolyngbya cf. ectocarpi LEGE 11479]|uniref:Uncharacterized protein n=1 Tax=Leptolyngbya cf. ectocarpi LEGE 11479 TaxID=1828722 RepID=A0A928ZUX2_LEPEC|nr:hypothetical protein [Leptolyngbya ectocarpi]MBE9067906.1 hypothetical protein [Leptolyngbya cf. ectocarpi LEGE 11479]